MVLDNSTKVARILSAERMLLRRLSLDGRFLFPFSSKATEPITCHGNSTVIDDLVPPRVDVVVLETSAIPQQEAQVHSLDQLGLVGVGSLQQGLMAEQQQDQLGTSAVRSDVLSLQPSTVDNGFNTPTRQEIKKFRGISKLSQTETRSSARVRAQGTADLSSLEKAMRIAQRRDDDHTAGLVVSASAIAIHLLSRSRSRGKKSKLPPGSLGLPLIGQTLGLIRALRTNSGNRWIRDRIDKYGPVSKLSLFGRPTVILAGPAGNKLSFFSSQLRMGHLDSIKRLVGEKSITDLHGDDHRRVRGALVEFLKPDMLKLYVGRIDAQVRQHLDERWNGHTTLKVLPLMKQLTFDVITALLFGLETGPMRAALAGDLVRLLDGALAIPVNLPFTPYSRALKASQRVRRLLEDITRDKKARLRQGNNNDFITSLLSLTDDHGQQLIADEEIVDNSISALIGGHDTTAILLTFMVRQLANDPVTLAAMVQEHEEIARNKATGKALTYEDLSRMKFTWRVAQETLRTVPPILGGFRAILEDIEFDGYCIPKGWQVFWMANVTHMDPGIFHEPAKFDPSRFDSKSHAMPPCSFVAFGGGPRICPGIEFTKIETLVVMHHLVRRFSWKLCCKENTFVINLFPYPLHGLPIQLEHKTSP